MVIREMVGIQQTQRVRHIIHTEAAAGGGDEQGFEEILRGQRCDDDERGEWYV